MANRDNPGVGSRFTETIKTYLESSNGWQLVKEFPVSIQANPGGPAKHHSFDLGDNQSKVLVECKSHAWTAGGNAPSAKMSVWNEAMYYFLLVENDFRKMLWVLRSVWNGESLAQYYVRRYEHLIPLGVEIWEFDEGGQNGIRVFPQV